MTRRVLPALLVTLLVLAARGVTAQQSASDLLAQGIGAYQNLDYDQAATVLRRGLARTTDTLSTADRLRALTYLGATELFRDRRDSALSAFRQIAVSDPKYRPSEIIFPPQVTNVFQDVRQQTKTVFLQVAPVTEFRAKVEHLTARLVASSPHDIAVAITLPDGKSVRDIFAGPIAESLAVSWDGLTDEGEPVKSGRYLLRVTSRGIGAGHLVRQLALEIERARPDTRRGPPGRTAPRRRCTRLRVRRCARWPAAWRLPSPWWCCPRSSPRTPAASKADSRSRPPSAAPGSRALSRSDPRRRSMS